MLIFVDRPTDIYDVASAAELEHQEASLQEQLAHLHDAPTDLALIDAFGRYADTHRCRSAGRAISQWKQARKRLHRPVKLSAALETELRRRFADRSTAVNS